VPLELFSVIGDAICAGVRVSFSSQILAIRGLKYRSTVVGKLLPGDVSSNALMLSILCLIMRCLPTTVFVCTDCGADSPRWAGQCSACKAWNTIKEVRLGNDSQGSQRMGYSGTKSTVQLLSDVTLKSTALQSLGNYCRGMLAAMH
jgi:hypothetical protein